MTKQKQTKKNNSLVTLDNVQQKTFDWALTRLNKKQYGVVFGHETGFGKSFVALSLIEHLLKPEQLFLILCPAHLVPNWKIYIEEYYPVLLDRVIYTTFTNLSEIVHYRFVSQHKYRYVVIDEVHYIKNPDSKRSQAVTGEPPLNSNAGKLDFENPKGLKKFGGQFLTLSGSWFTNHIGDLFPVLQFFRHPMTRYGYEAFCREYGENVYRNHYGLQVKPGLKNVPRLLKNLSNIYITAKNTAKGRRVVRWLKAEKALLKIERDFIVEAAKRLKIGQLTYETILHEPEILKNLIDAIPSFTEFQVWKGKIGFLKTKPILEDIKENILPETQKFIIFCYNKSIVDFYYEKLKKKVHCEQVTSEIYGIEERHEALIKFDKLKECVLICTMDSVREGYNLPNFNLSLFAQSDFRPYVLRQCEGRTTRKFQKNSSVWIHYLFDSGLDRYTWKAVLAKMDSKNKIDKSLMIKEGK
jgi:hypothetical protein